MVQIYNSKFNTQDKFLLFLHLIIVFFLLLLNLEFNNSTIIKDSSNYGIKEIYDPIILKFIISNYGIYFPNIFNMVILPFVSFLIFILIFYKYIPMLWAISISLLSVLQSNEMHLRDFILLKIKVTDNFANLAITNFPYPSLSIFLFLFIIYITLRININKFNSLKTNFLKTIFILISWSFLIHIQPLDGILGFLFSFIYLNMNLYKSFNIKILNPIYLISILLLLIINFLIILINVDLNTIVRIDQENDITLYFITFYLIMPIFSLLILYYFQKIDKFEIIFKFSNIFILIFIELFLVLLFKFYNINFITHITLNRSTVFFLHFYYYVPFIYYLIRPTTNLDKNKIPIYVFIKNNLNNISFLFLNLFSFLIYFNSVYIIFS